MMVFVSGPIDSPPSGTVVASSALSPTADPTASRAAKRYVRRVGMSSFLAFEISIRKLPLLMVSLLSLTSLMASRQPL